MRKTEQTFHSAATSPFAQASVWCIGCLLATAFFFTEHSVTTSLKTAFTLSADEMVSEAGGGNPWRRVSFLVVAISGVVAFFIRQQSPLKLPNLLTFCIGLLLSYCVASVLWSVDASITVRRLFVLLLALLGSAGLGSQFRFRELTAIALIAAGSLVVNGLVCEVGLGTFRPWSGEYRFSGSLHPNTQGVYLATVLFSALCLSKCDLPNHRYWHWGIMGVAFVLLVLTKSRTSTAGVMMVWGCMWLALHHSAWRLVLPIGGAWLLSSGLLAALLCGADVDHYLAKLAFMGREEQTESFSGRTTIWPAVSAFIQQRYWIGHGYDSFWTPHAIEEITRECQWPVREAHSAYYETMLHLGAIGLGLLLTTVGLGVVVSFTTFVGQRDPSLLFWTAMLLNGLFNGVFESGMVMITLPTFVISLGLMRLALIREVVPNMNKQTAVTKTYRVPVWGVTT